MAFCYDMLDRVSRSFAAVIRQLPQVRPSARLHTPLLPDPYILWHLIDAAPPSPPTDPCINPRSSAHWLSTYLLPTDRKSRQGLCVETVVFYLVLRALDTVRPSVGLHLLNWPA